MVRKRPASKPQSIVADRVRAMAAAVRRRRRELGLTQIELCRFAGCGPDFLYDLEKGKATLRLTKVLDVLLVLGLELRLVEGRGALTVDERLAADRGATS